MAISDWLIPVRADQVWEPSDLKGYGCTRLHRTCWVSDPLWAVGSESDKAEREGERFTGVYGFSEVLRRGAGRGCMTAMLQWFPEARKWMTACSTARGARGHGRQGRLPPPTEGRRGWTRCERRRASVTFGSRYQARSATN
jgi:hypothetical protein